MATTPAVFGDITEPQALELMSAEPTTSGRLNVTYRLAARIGQTAEQSPKADVRSA